MLKKGASLDCSAKKGGNRLYCSVKCLYPGGGGVIIRGSSASRSDPLPFYLPFFSRKDTPFVYLPLENSTPFTNLLKNTASPF